MIAEAQQARADALAMRESGAKNAGRLVHVTASDSGPVTDAFSKMSIQVGWASTHTHTHTHTV